MRLWSIHPQYLDKQGLLALWREALLAKKVLEGKTRGYKNHPQLIRFKAYKNPVKAIHVYLRYVWEEAKRRSYHFDKSKFEWIEDPITIPVTRGQLLYEKVHLYKKLLVRSVMDSHKLIGVDTIAHPLFAPRSGDKEGWEKNAKTN